MVASLIFLLLISTRGSAKSLAAESSRKDVEGAVSSSLIRARDEAIEGDLRLSSALYAKAINSLRKHHLLSISVGQDNMELSACFLEWASVEIMNNQFGNAGRHLQEGITIFMKVPEKDRSFDYSLLLADLGTVCNLQGDTIQGRQLVQQAMDRLSDKQRRDFALASAAYCSHVAAKRVKRGRLESALAAQKLAVMLEEKTFGRAHIEDYRDMAKILEKSGNLLEAEVWAEKSVLVTEKEGGELSDQSIYEKAHIAELKAKKKDFDSSISILEDLISVVDKKPNHRLKPFLQDSLDEVIETRDKQLGKPVLKKPRRLDHAQPFLSNY